MKMTVFAISTYAKMISLLQRKELCQKVPEMCCLCLLTADIREALWVKKRIFILQMTQRSGGRGGGTRGPDGRTPQNPGAEFALPRREGFDRSSRAWASRTRGIGQHQLVTGDYSGLMRSKKRSWGSDKKPLL